MAACLARAVKPKSQGIFRNFINERITHGTFRTVGKRLFHVSFIQNVAGIPIKMPSLSPTMSEGTIVKWLKQEGDSVQPGDIICDIQTDKAVVSFEVEEEGILAKIIMGEDSKDIAVGQLIGLMVEPGEDWKTVEIPPDAPAAGASTSSDTAPEQSSAEATAEYSGMRHTVAAPTTVGPAVRTLLELYGVDAARVPATGPHGNLVKGDVLAYVTEHRLTPQPPAPVPAPANAAQPPSTAPVSSTAPRPQPLQPQQQPQQRQAAPAGDYVDLPLSSMRKTIAKRLTQSKTEIPHAYSQSEARIDRLLSLRKQLKAEGVQASLNDYIIKIVGLCLRLHPEMNCVWTGDRAERAADVDVSIAVATDAGLITPIVRGAADSSVAAISRAVQDLAARARDGKLRPNEFQGGTFTISNLGMFGVDEFSAIINPPQCGILAVGGGRKEIGPDGDAQTWMTCTLSYDARAVSEQDAAAFMETLATLLSAPDLLQAESRRQQLLD